MRQSRPVPLCLIYLLYFFAFYGKIQYDKERNVKMKRSDKIIKFLAHSGKIAVMCADTTNLVEKAR